MITAATWRNLLNPHKKEPRGGDEAWPKETRLGKTDEAWHVAVEIGSPQLALLASRVIRR